MNLIMLITNYVGVSNFTSRHVLTHEAVFYWFSSRFSYFKELLLDQRRKDKDRKE